MGQQHSTIQAQFDQEEIARFFTTIWPVLEKALKDFIIEQLRKAEPGRFGIQPAQIECGIRPTNASQSESVQHGHESARVTGRVELEKEQSNAERAEHEVENSNAARVVSTEGGPCELQSNKGSHLTVNIHVIPLPVRQELIDSKPEEFLGASESLIRHGPYTAIQMCYKEDWKTSICMRYLTMGFYKLHQRVAISCGNSIEARRRLSCAVQCRQPERSSDEIDKEVKSNSDRGKRYSALAEDLTDIAIARLDPGLRSYYEKEIPLRSGQRRGQRRRNYIDMLRQNGVSSDDEDLGNAVRRLMTYIDKSFHEWFELYKDAEQQTSRKRPKLRHDVGRNRELHERPPVGSVPTLTPSITNHGRPCFDLCDGLEECGGNNSACDTTMGFGLDASTGSEDGQHTTRSIGIVNIERNELPSIRSVVSESRRESREQDGHGHYGTQHPQGNIDTPSAREGYENSHGIEALPNTPSPSTCTRLLDLANVALAPPTLSHRLNTRPCGVDGDDSVMPSQLNAVAVQGAGTAAQVVSATSNRRDSGHEVTDPENNYSKTPITSLDNGGSPPLPCDALGLHRTGNEPHTGPPLPNENHAWSGFATTWVPSPAFAEWSMDEVLGWNPLSDIAEQDVVSSSSHDGLTERQVAELNKHVSELIEFNSNK